MEPLVFEHDTVYLHFDRGILELFRRDRVYGAYRTPLQWVKVRAETRKGGVVALHFGNIEHLDEPLYAPATERGQLLAKVDIAAADEPRFRAYFAELASLANRPIV
jgi:hypothetical protein